jgi:hypothetical protein
MSLLTIFSFELLKSNDSLIWESYYTVIRFCAELYAIAYELQPLLKYISILLLGWCHYLVMEPTTVSTIKFTNASFDVGVYVVASHDDTSRVWLYQIHKCLI